MGQFLEKIPDNTEKPTVSIARCKEYDYELVRTSIELALKPMGGIENYVKPGERVLVKPNLISDSPPEKLATTNPTVVEAVVNLVKEAGATPIIGDSPGLASFRKAAKAAGIEEVARSTGAQLAEFKNSIPLNNGHIFKHIEVAEEVKGCDKIINLPKLKTHIQMAVTLGVKNMFGCVIGRRKSMWHLMAGRDRRYFATMMVELYRAVKPTLTIMDGIIAMHKEGPQNGEPYPMGLVYVSNDAVAMDSAITHQIGLPIEKNPILAAAIEKRAGETELEKISFPEMHPLDVVAKDFVVPDLSDLEIGPKILRQYLRDWLVPKPITLHQKCTLCRKCIGVCPPDVIEVVDNKITINYEKCIRCFCCVEICPEAAMTVHHSLASKMLQRFG